MKELFEQVKQFLEQSRIFNVAGSWMKYKSETKINGVYSRNNVPKIKVVVYVINLNEYKSVITYWIALYVNDDSGSISHKPI